MPPCVQISTRRRHASVNKAYIGPSLPEEGEKLGPLDTSHRWNLRMVRQIKGQELSSRIQQCLRGKSCMCPRDRRKRGRGTPMAESG